MSQRKYACRRTSRYTDMHDAQRPNQVTPFTFADARGHTDSFREQVAPPGKKNSLPPPNLPVLPLHGDPHSPGPGPAELARTWDLAEA